MKNCLRESCNKEFNPNKPKQVFCSAKCRVYYSRESKRPISENKPIPKSDLEIKAEAFNKSSKMEDKHRVPIDGVIKHPLWREGDPKEGSGAFFLKFNASCYDDKNFKRY